MQFNGTSPATGPGDAKQPAGRGAARVRVVGCGRSHRRDDQLGLRAAELLAIAPPPGTEIVTSESAGVDLVADLESVDLLVVVDAARAGSDAAPGRIARLALSDGSLRLSDNPQPAMGESSHFMGIMDGLRLAEALGALPQDVWIYVVAASDFGYGDGMSPEVERALHTVSGRIRADLRSWFEQRDGADGELVMARRRRADGPRGAVDA
ncbi:MAG: hypothetical protein CHACPFDD_02343 [Phycisphaerae bacterium]|nr:hypothetical protein [Phycisphaerae bacterium]